MTLVLTLVTTRYVVQVADRLVTTDGKRFDPTSNKSLIYLGRNAIVAIAYSGLAYLEGIPTDEWIAQTLWGRKLPRRDDGRAVGHFLGGEPRQSVDRDIAGEWTGPHLKRSSFRSFWQAGNGGTWVPEQSGVRFCTPSLPCDRMVKFVVMWITYLDIGIVKGGCATGSRAFHSECSQFH